MFHLSERLSPSNASPTQGRRYLKRAVLFAGGILLLWISLQLLPNGTGPGHPPVYSDDAGTVAAQSDAASEGGTPSLFTPGSALAVLLLGGGVTLAVYLRRKSTRRNDASAIAPLGEYAMGPNQSLRLIECGGEILLVGVTAGQISLLRSYPADRFDTAEMIGPSAATADGSHFGDLLRRYASPHAQVEVNGTSC